MSTKLKQWTDTDKAFWILEHGDPKYAWIFERNSETIYRRPLVDPGTKLPPWISSEREAVSNKITGKQFTNVWIDEDYMNTVTKEEKPFETEEGRQWLQDMLRMGAVTVTFTKKDGEQRVMTCTLQEESIPENQQPKPLAEGQEARKRSDANLSVWDINAEGWRSFILANVSKVEFSL